MELKEKHDINSYEIPEQQIQDSKIRKDLDNLYVDRYLDEVKEEQKEKDNFMGSSAEKVNKPLEEIKQVENWHSETSLNKLNDVLYYYCTYLSTQENNVYDIEFSKQILNALYELKNNEVFLMEFVFAELEERAEKDQKLASVLPEWKGYFNAYKEIVAQKMHKESKQNYKKISLFEKFINKIQSISSYEETKTKVK